MPRPRFDKLDPVVRTRILQAAAQEFSAYSYDDASVNRVIEQADISKGSLYYYFDDKEDLFRAALQYLEECTQGLSRPCMDELTAENYWDKLEEYARRGREIVRTHPWIIGFSRIFLDALRNPPTQGPLAEWFQRCQKIRSDLIQRGLELGLVRKDIPLELLITVLNGVEVTMHQWVFQHWSELAEEARENFGFQMLDLTRRILQTGTAGAPRAPVVDRGEPAADRSAGKPPTRSGRTSRS